MNGPRSITTAGVSMTETSWVRERHDPLIYPTEPMTARSLASTLICQLKFGRRRVEKFNQALVWLIKFRSKQKVAVSSTLAAFVGSATD